MRRTVLLLVSGALAVLFLVGAAALDVQEAKATTPGNNGRIAFVKVPDLHHPDQEAPDIYTMNRDGTDVSQFTQTPDTEDDPAWSPDGSKIAFSDDWQDIIVEDFPGGTPINLSSSAYADKEPEWSPDGSRIAFYSIRPGSGVNIWTMDSSNGANQTQLSHIPTQAEYSAWSPDGSKVAFLAYGSSGFRGGFYTVNSNGTGQRYLAPGGYNPDYSPYGKKIVFMQNNDIWVMHADGTHRKSLTNTSALEYEPAFSPNGKKIVYSKRTLDLSQRGTTAEQDWNIWKMDADGRHRENLTNTPLYDEYQPDWQPVP